MKTFLISIHNQLKFPQSDCRYSRKFRNAIADILEKSATIKQSKVDLNSTSPQKNSAFICKLQQRINIFASTKDNHNAKTHCPFPIVSQLP